MAVLMPSLLIIPVTTATKSCKITANYLNWVQVSNFRMKFTSEEIIFSAINQASQELLLQVKVFQKVLSS